MIAALLPELLSIGGVQLAGRQTAAALAAITDERGSPYRFLSLNDASGENEASVGHLRFQFRGFGRNRLLFVLAAWQLAQSKPKIIFAAHPNLAPVTAAMKIYSTNSGIIVGTHGIEVWHPLSSLRRRALRHADIVLAPSSDTARKIAEIQGVPDEKVHILPWPLDPNFLGIANSPDKLPLPAEFPSGRVILTVGRWAANERYKGADLLIETVASLASDFPEVHLVLVGSGDDLPRLKSLAQATEMSKRVHFLSDLTRKELVACYAHSEIFALPSSGEGFGFVFLEAMSMNKPVVGTMLGGIPDVIEDGETGILIDPKIPGSLARALRALLSDAGLRLRMGRRAGDVVRERFSFSRFQGDLRKILSSAAEM